MNTGHGKSSFKVFGKLETNHMLLYATSPSLHHQRKTNHSSSFLIRHRIVKQEALPLSAQTAQGLGWSQGVLFVS